MPELASELPPQYDPKAVEERIYRLWEESGFFNPDNLPDAENRKPYTIIMPPPNANGHLHVGHALFVTVEDILIRYARMSGKRALWLPGMDHAGFETQVVFEKKLEKEGRSRFQMTREEFYKQCWDFVQEHKTATENGLRRLGASCDWSRNTFTLDPRIIEIVHDTFAKMYQDGILYRGNRVCNWCPKHQTSLSDLETRYEERTEPYYYFKYGPFTISTSRPETKFGDKHVVMHPDDKRYEKYKSGDTFSAEWINGPITAKVLKDPSIDMAFGTGIMTITPAHDTTDFDIAQRHNLEIEQVIDRRGHLLPIAGEFAGLKILDARAKIVEKLKSKGLLEKIDENYKHSVQVCFKCGNLIEPQVIPQWYVAMTKALPHGRPSLRDMAVTAIKSKKVEILNEHFEKTLLYWLENIRDWPISRQIAWGISIPAYFCKEDSAKQKPACREPIVSTQPISACPHCEGPVEQDPDTFDTWFSSGQWPYAALMIRDKKDFGTYFPTQVMESGWDIIFFWVARMIMFSYYRTGKPPFEKVYLHGLVRDKDRQKMSKSKGNVIDPLGVIDTYGTDALRMALVFSTSAGNDIPLSEDKIRGMKHFANKLWNIARFVITNSPAAAAGTSSAQVEPVTEADKNILGKLETTIQSVTNHLDKYRLHEAAQDIYQFTWHELADVYLEASKAQLKDESLKNTTALILHNCIEKTLILLHPFMPFITEEIWQKMHEQNTNPVKSQSDHGASNGRTGTNGEYSMLMVEKW